uniref:Uncharacterized protein n=1 Tax=Ciona savignyi TaxID=51511 RepID=H2YLX0_CIOSA
KSERKEEKKVYTGRLRHREKSTNYDESSPDGTVANSNDDATAYVTPDSSHPSENGSSPTDVTYFESESYTKTHSESYDVRATSSKDVTHQSTYDTYRTHEHHLAAADSYRSYHPPMLCYHPSETFHDSYERRPYYNSYPGHWNGYQQYYHANDATSTHRASKPQHRSRKNDRESPETQSDTRCSDTKRTTSSDHKHCGRTETDGRDYARRLSVPSSCRYARKYRNDVSNDVTNSMTYEAKLSLQHLPRDVALVYKPGYSHQPYLHTN